jgi:4-amino-4-deoxy-L-arabinose transferase-like glycosyltransferase
MVGLLILMGTALRVTAALRPGLWADEIFSLSMATGHSLEHPAAIVNPALGDFSEPDESQSPAFFSRYTEHEDPPAGARRVVRAVLLSDTSPPLYYLLLNQWTRIFGTGDAALRLFSTWWAFVSLPLLWLVGRKLGDATTAWSACLLFSFAPVAVFYSAEGRMYSLLWFIGLGLGWLTLRLSASSDRLWPSMLWVLIGVAGLLTHYFFAFVWLACLGWLWLDGRMARQRLMLLAGATLVAVLPWYLEVPASLGSWRVSGSWLEGDLVWPRALGRPFTLAGSLLSGSTLLGGWRVADRLLTLLLALTAIWLVSQGRVRHVFSHRPLLIWFWLSATCVGPLIFDVLRHTTTTEIPRYVLPAMPAAVLLAALMIRQLPPVLHAGMLACILLAWLPGNRRVIHSNPARPWQPYTELDARLEAWARPGDVVLVSSIPSGSLGVARYLRPDIPMAPWVSQLGVRQVPADIERLVIGRARVAYVSIHSLGGSVAPEEWLRSNGRLLGREEFPKSSAKVLYFGPPAGDTVFRAASPIVQRFQN